MAIKEPRTFENTITPFARQEAILARGTDSIGFLKQVSTSKEVREAAEKSAKLTGDYAIDLGMRVDLY